MVTTPLCILLAATAVTAIQIGFAPAPVTSYIYVNHGPPASYHQAHVAHDAFVNAPALPVSYPVKAIETYNIAPVPLPYVAAKSVQVEDTKDDDGADVSDSYHDGSDHSEGDVVEEGLAHGSTDGSHDGDDHSEGFDQAGANGFTTGTGNEYREEQYGAHGEEGAKGFKSQSHLDKGEKGHYGKEHHKGFYNEAAGGKKGHYDEADAHGKHYEAEESYKGGDHGHKKHYSKGEKVSGYHNVYHKDEYKKDHDFYDVADKSGHFKKYGFQEANHETKKDGHKKGGHHDSAFDKGGFGKAGFLEKGHIDDGSQSHSSEEGKNGYYHNEAEYGNKGDSSDEKGYGYVDGNDGDDNDDYDDDYSDDDKHE